MLQLCDYMIWVEARIVTANVWEVQAFFRTRDSRAHLRIRYELFVLFLDSFPVRINPTKSDQHCSLVYIGLFQLRYDCSTNAMYGRDVCHVSPSLLLFTLLGLDVCSAPECANDALG